MTFFVDGFLRCFRCKCFFVKIRRYGNMSMFENLCLACEANAHGQPHCTNLRKKHGKNHPLNGSHENLRVPLPSKEIRPFIKGLLTIIVPE